MRRALLLGLLLAVPVAAAGVPEPVRGDLVVTFVDGVAPPSGLPLLSVVPAFVLPDATPAQAARWAADPRVERVDWAVPLERHGLPALPTSAFTSLTRAEDGATTGAGVTVAVVDSGIDAAHPDLAGQVRTNVRLVDGAFVASAGDTDGHGTHVAGIVAASGVSSGGRWRGIAPDAKLVGVDISGRFTTASALLAYDWMYANRERYDIDVVVNAWGRVKSGETFDARDPGIRAIDRLVASGVVVLFSAANHGPGPGTLSIEAMHPRVITVGATDAAGVLAPFSSRGPVAATPTWTKPDVVAPGDAVAGLRSAQTAPRAEDPDAFHALYSGTSQAVPHVAGIVARLLEARPDLTPDAVAVALRASAIDLGAPGPDDETGYGLVDAHDALRVALGGAPDRSNVLVAGGLDRARDAADVAATPRRALLDLVTQPQVVWETPFAVKLGAQRLRVDAHVEGAQSVSVELAHGARVVRATSVDAPEPGVWTLRVRASVPVAARAEATFETTLPPAPERALVQDGRSPVVYSPPASTGPELVGGVPGWTWLPLGMWAASGMLLAYALMPRRRSEE